MPDWIQKFSDGVHENRIARCSRFSELLFRVYGPSRRFVPGVCVLVVALGCREQGLPATATGPDVATAAAKPPPPETATAKVLLDAGRYEAAERLLTTLLEADPRQPTLGFLRTLAVQKQKRYALALEAWNQLATVEQDYPEKRHLEHYRGWCLFYLGRPGDAADAFERHLAMVPDEPDSHFGLGVARLDMARPDDALRSLDRAIEIDLGTTVRRRSLGKAWIRRGDALWELDRIDDAAHSYHKGVIQFADHYEGWAKLARAHDRLGGEDDAAWARREESRARARVGQVEGATGGDS